MKAHNGEKSETIVKTVLLFHQLHTSAILQFNLFPTLVRIWTNTVFFIPIIRQHILHILLVKKNQFSS